MYVEDVHNECKSLGIKSDKTTSHSRKKKCLLQKIVEFIATYTTDYKVNSLHGRRNCPRDLTNELINK